MSNFLSYFNAVLGDVIAIIFSVTYSLLRLIVTVLDADHYSSTSFSFNIEPVDDNSQRSALFTAVSIFVAWSAYLHSLARLKRRQEYNVIGLAQVFINFLFCLLYFYFRIFYLAPFRVIAFYYCHLLPEY